MKFNRSVPYALCCIAVAFAGCSGVVNSNSSTPSTPDNAVRSSIVHGWAGPPAGARTHAGTPLQRVGAIVRPSRMQPNCCPQMLFVSEANSSNPAVGAVEMFKYPQGTAQGPLPAPPGGFQQPQGECVGSPQPQPVFIANTSASTIEEYSHSGLHQLQLSDPGQLPVSCAYRSTGPNSGVLAVGNITSIGGGQGSISVYTDNNGNWTPSPTVYVPSPLLEAVFFVAYKNTTLYLDGIGYSFQPIFAKMSPGGAFTMIPISGATIDYPGGLQTVGSNFAIGDQSPSGGSPNIYQISATGAVLPGGTTLSPAPSAVIQFFRKGSRVVAPDYYNANADIYHYPAGNLATPVVTTIYPPIGAVVSQQ